MSTSRFPQNDYEKNRVLGGLGYIIFFLPLIACPQSPYGKHCANQGLIVVLANIALILAQWIVALILGWIPILGAIINWAFRLATYAVDLLAIYYCYLAICRNDARTFPYVGGFKLLH